VKRLSDRPRRDAIAIIAYWAIWCGTAFAIGAYFIAYGLLTNAIESPVVKQALFFGMPLLIGIVALSTNPLLQFRRNSEAMYIVSRARDGRSIEAEFFLYLRPLLAGVQTLKEHLPPNLRASWGSHRSLLAAIRSLALEEFISLMTSGKALSAS
jgi:hypothetical protein